MNKRIIYVLSLFLIIFSLWSCTDEDTTPTLDSNASTTLTSDKTSVVLLQANDALTAVNLNWTNPDFVTSVVKKYSIYFDKKGNNFANPQIIKLGSVLTDAISVKDLNAIVIALGIKEYVATDIEIKVVVNLGYDYNAVESNIVTLNVTAYPGVLDLSTTWGIVGSGAPNGWPNSGDKTDHPFYKGTVNTTGLTDNTGVYVAFIKLNNGEIKFRENFDWANNFGDNGADGKTDAGGANIAVTAGYYRIIWNSNTTNYKIEKFSWGIIGDATPNGWASDTDLIYDPYSDQFRNEVALTAGKIKFRKDDDWATNLGGSLTALTQGGADITVTPGKYIVTLKMNYDLSVASAKLESISNIWGLIGSATPTAWATPDNQMHIDYSDSSFKKWIIRGINLTAAEIKFRADNDWALNYGGSGGTLTAGGPNIAVAAAGYYDVVLNLTNSTSPTYTLTKK